MRDGARRDAERRPRSRPPFRGKRRHRPRRKSAVSQGLQPEQIAQRLPIDFPDDQPPGHLSGALRSRSRGAPPRIDGLLANGARVKSAQSVVSPEIMISQRPPMQLIEQCRATERETSFLVSGAQR